MLDSCPAFNDSSCRSGTVIRDSSQNATSTFMDNRRRTCYERVHVVWPWRVLTFETVDCHCIVRSHQELFVPLVGAK